MRVEIIVRTTHGTADVLLEVHDDDATLRELITLVSGRTAPPVVLVDGRIVDTARPIRSAGLMAGSEIDTDVDRVPARAVSRSRLLQLTGSGAGTIRPLGIGTYRLGPGARVNVDELVVGRVDRPAFEVSVGADSTVLRPVPLMTQSVTHAGQPLAADVVWTSGLVVAGGRTFAHERGLPSGGQGPAAIDDAGRMVHERHPVPEDVEQRLVMIDARRDAEMRRAALWAARTGSDASCCLAVGLRTDTMCEVDIDIAADPVVVLAGEVSVAAAHARALVLDAVTRYGPADLDVAVAAEADDLHRWDWVKWLPHAVGGGSVPQLFGANDPADLAAFAGARLTGRGTHESSRRTLLVVVGDSLWSAPWSPLHRLVAECPRDLSLLLLTDRRRHAPERWTTLIEHPETSSTGHAVLLHRSAPDTPQPLLAPLPTTATAADIARHLAALVDPELPQPSSARPTRDHPRTLAELVAGGHPTARVGVRWNTRVGVATPARMPIGVADSSPITVDLGLDRGVVVSGSSLADAADVVRTLLASMATAWSPHELAIVWVDHRAGTRPEPLRSLPHHAGTFSETGSRAGRRFTSRLATELLAPTPTARRVAVVVDSPAATEAAAPGLVDGLARLATAAGGIHLILATDEPLAALDDRLRSVCTIGVTVDRVAAVRHATVQENRLHTPFTPFEPPATASAPVEVAPWVFARPLTALERHVARLGAGHDAASRAEREYEGLVSELARRAASAELHPLRPLVPSPLPARVPAEPLSAATTGAGVPLGLVARPDLDEPVPYRWRPDRAPSLVVVGGAASGVHGLLDVLLVGVVERYAGTDVQLFVIDADDTRRSALRARAHVHGVASPHEDDAVNALFEAAEEVGRTGTPTPVVVVRDLDQLSAERRARLAELIGAHAPAGVHLVAAAHDVAAATEFLRAPVRFVVGALDDPAGYASLGIDDHSDIVGSGRCLVGREQLLMQVAEAADPLVTALAARPQPPATFAPPTPTAASGAPG